MGPRLATQLPATILPYGQSASEHSFGILRGTCSRLSDVTKPSNEPQVLRPFTQRTSKLFPKPRAKTYGRQLKASKEMDHSRSRHGNDVSMACKLVFANIPLVMHMHTRANPGSEPRAREISRELNHGSHRRQRLSREHKCHERDSKCPNNDASAIDLYTPLLPSQRRTTALKLAWKLDVIEPSVELLFGNFRNFQNFGGIRNRSCRPRLAETRKVLASVAGSAQLNPCP